MRDVRCAVGMHEATRGSAILVARRRSACAECDAACGAEHTNRRSAIDSRTIRHSDYAVSGQVRKRIENVFGWIKTTAGFSQDASPWSGPRRLDVHADGHGLQPGPAAQAGAGMPSEYSTHCFASADFFRVLLEAVTD